MKQHLITSLIFVGISTPLIIGILMITVRKHTRQLFMSRTRLSIMNKEIQKACRYIEANYANPLLTPTTLSQALITGEPFLEALFEREMGMSTKGFIEQVRVNRVKLYLDKNNTADTETIAAACGFNDAGGLAQSFQSVTGTSFNDYRQALSIKG